MCPSQARRRLGRFIRYITQAHPPGETQLIINGDFIDFLAEEAIPDASVPPFEAFTSNPSHALAKLQRVILARMMPHLPRQEFSPRFGILSAQDTR
jgi:hypothetical protein